MATAAADPNAPEHHPFEPLPFKPPEEGPRRATILEVLEQINVDEAHVPEEFLVAEKDRPTIAYNEGADFADIPVIDLSRKDTNRVGLANELRDAATGWGFCQLINHGLSLETMREVQTQGLNFFHLPAKVKQNLGSTHVDGRPSLYVGDNTVDKPSSLHWAECLRLPQMAHLEMTVGAVWPNGNAEFRDAITEFMTNARTINRELLELFAEGLGLETDRFSQSSDSFVGVRWNFYPACPLPSSILGAKSHTDGTCLSILQQDQVGGLQILQDGEWLGIKPIEGALVVFVGDELHAWTNGRFKNVIHRVVVNQNVQRLSVGAFFHVDRDVPISAPDELVDETHPRLYRPFTSIEFLKQLYAIRGKETLENICREGFAVLNHFKLVCS